MSEADDDVIGRTGGVGGIGPGGGGGTSGGVRSFVAVPLPSHLQTDLLTAARGLAPELPEVKWTRKVENLHITVQFLGPVPAPRLQTLAGALAEDLAPRSPFSVELRGLGAFPDGRHATAIWVGVVDEDGRLDAVAASVRRLTARMGLVSERRPFRPHVTVGRCKRGVDARAALEPWRARSLGTASVTEIRLYESQLGREGSTYLPRGQAPLLGARPA